jgi:hypothetical protein
MGGWGTANLASEFSGKPFDQTVYAMCHEFVHKIVPSQVVQEHHLRLLNDGTILGMLEQTRGIDRATAIQWKLGLDESSRITVPIEGPFGFYSDMRRWDALRITGGVKNLPYEKGYSAGSRAQWWPLPFTGKNDVMICEGEPDTLRAITAGYSAVTAIGGATAFLTTEWSWASDKSITICPHRDAAGLTALGTIRDAIRKAGVSRWREVVPEAPYKDLTDWIMGVGETRVKNIIEASPWCSAEEPQEVAKVSLEDLTSAKLARVEVIFDAQISSVSSQPYLVPKEFRIQCNGSAGDLCWSCPNAAQHHHGKYEVKCTDDAYLNVIGAQANTIPEMLRMHAGIPPVCEFPVEIVNRQGSLPVTLIPADTRYGKDVTYVTRGAVFSGHHIQPGSTARFRGYTREHPRDQQSITILSSVLTALKPHEGFIMPEPIGEDLIAVYANRDPFEMLMWNAMIIARYHTKVVGRDLMHVAMDTVFHSILEFPYGGLVSPGFLDLLVFGSSSTGKGQCAEGMIHLYELGEFISGKRCTVPGLIGGTIRHNKGMDVAPGAWPLRNGDLAVMDEATKPEVFSQLTRARRDGLAEFTQAGISQRLPALVRKIWLQNPPEGTTFNDYRYGAEIIRVLGGTEEDTARWDLALAVESDVSEQDIINASEPIKNDPPMSREAFQAKVRWAWSRKIGNIIWTTGARKAVLSETPKLVAKFETSNIGLVQKGNTHHKLRKLSAAIAACVYSTTDHINLTIDAPHVHAAAKLMDVCLSSESLALHKAAAVYKQSNVVGDENALLAPLKKLGWKGRSLRNKILAQGTASRRTWEAFFGGAEGPQVVDLWLREGGLKESGRDLHLTRAFADVLRMKL